MAFTRATFIQMLDGQTPAEQVGQGPARQHEFALMFAALANELVAWRQRNPMASPSLNNAPVIWHMHEAIKDRPINNDAASLRITADRLREKLTQAQPAIGTHTLSDDEAERLFQIMRDTGFRHIAPYVPPPAAAVW